MLDTSPEKELDDLVALAADICQAPVATVSLLDADREWFMAKIGTAMTEIPLGSSLCPEVLRQREVFTVPDTAAEERFAINPHIRFFAGAPLLGPDGVAIGGLCVTDHQPRTLTASQEKALQVLAGQVMTHLELRRRMGELSQTEQRFRTMADAIPHLAWIANADGWIYWYNRRWYGSTPERRRRRWKAGGWQSMHDPAGIAESAGALE